MVYAVHSAATSRDVVRAGDGGFYPGEARVWLVAAVAALCVCGATAPVSAEDGKTDAEKAQTHFDRGVQHYLTDEYQQAILEFRKAQNLRPHPAFLYNIARAHVRLGECEEAVSAIDDIDSSEKLDEKSHAKAGALEVGCRAATRARFTSDGISEEAEQKRAEDEEEAAVARREPGPPAGTDTGEASSGESGVPESRRAPIWNVVSWSAIGVGAAALAGGAILEVVSQDRYRTIERVDRADPRNQPEESELRKMRKQAKRRRAWTLGLYIGGASFLAGGIGSFFFPLGGREASAAAERERLSPRARLHVRPVVERLVTFEVAW